MTRLTIDNPAAIAVIVALIVLFGLISVRLLPIQLLPDVERQRDGQAVSLRGS